MLAFQNPAGNLYLGTKESDTADFSEAVARAVLEQYEALPKKGKPQLNEYTVLAGFVATQQELDGPQNQQTGFSVQGEDNPALLPMQHDPLVMPGHASLHVVSMGTGTKCLGFSNRSENGDVINDSHAEVRPCGKACHFHWSFFCFLCCTAHLRRRKFEQNQASRQVS
jgi:hypothetical protein